MSDVAKVIAGVVVLALLVAGGILLKYETAGPRGNLAANEQINSKDNRIVKDQLFFSDCAAVQDAESNIEAQQEALQTEKDPTQISRINQNIAALKGTRAEAVHDYNTNSDNVYLSGRFRSQHLPQYLPVTIPEGGTVCAAS